jgi:hypothetical protein
MEGDTVPAGSPAGLALARPHTRYVRSGVAAPTGYWQPSENAVEGAYQNTDVPGLVPSGRVALSRLPAPAGTRVAGEGG